MISLPRLFGGGVGTARPLAMAASRGRDVPVGVTARFESRGCLRVVVAKKCVPPLLHPLRCVTMLARSRRIASRLTGSPAPTRGSERARVQRPRL